MEPRLVAVAHGTRDIAGQRTIRTLVRRVARRLPDVPVTRAYVELNEPVLGSVMACADGPSIVVPLLLSTGHHVRHDLPEAARLSAHPAVIAGPLGPDPLLAAVACLRLRQAGARPGDPVVMVAAGSSDSDALVDVHLAGRMLQARWGSPVKVATLSGEGHRLGAVLDRLRSQGVKRVAVSPYLLALGHFHTQLTVQATAHGAAVLAGVLGAHPLVAEVVARRFHSTARASQSALPGHATGDAPGAGNRPGARVA